MTKSELKSIIMECLEEEGVVTEAFDEDEAIIENCLFIEESCFYALNENLLEIFDEAFGAYGDKPNPFVGNRSWGKEIGSTPAAQAAGEELKKVRAKLNIIKSDKDTLANKVVKKVEPKMIRLNEPSKYKPAEVMKITRAETSNAASEVVAQTLGSKFKAFNGKVLFTAKGHDVKLGHAIAAAATAVAATIAAIAVKKFRDKKKAEKEESSSEEE